MRSKRGLKLLALLESRLGQLSPCSGGLRRGQGGIFQGKDLNSYRSQNFVPGESRWRPWCCVLGLGPQRPQRYVPRIGCISTHFFCGYNFGWPQGRLCGPHEQISVER